MKYLLLLAALMAGCGSKTTVIYPVPTPTVMPILRPEPTHTAEYLRGFEFGKQEGIHDFFPPTPTPAPLPTEYQQGKLDGWNLELNRYMSREHP